PQGAPAVPSPTGFRSGSRVLGVNYSLGLGARGWRANLAASWMDYEVGGEFKPLELSGDARTFSAGVSYPLLRSRERNLWFSTDVDRKSTRLNSSHAKS